MLSRAPQIALSAALLMASLSPVHAADLGPVRTDEMVVRGQLPPDVELRSQMVAVGDLNLRTESGQSTLMGRIHQAVKNVCGSLEDLRNMQEAARYHNCGSVAMADATSKARTAIASARQSNEAIAALVVVAPAKQ